MEAPALRTVRGSRASTTLIDAAARGDFWLSPDLLREGTVVARLRTGDIGGARSAWIRLEPVSSRSADDVRPQLLAAWIMAASEVKSR